MPMASAILFESGRTFHANRTLFSPSTELQSSFMAVSGIAMKAADMPPPRSRMLNSGRRNLERMSSATSVVKKLSSVLAGGLRPFGNASLRITRWGPL